METVFDLFEDIAIVALGVLFKYCALKVSEYYNDRKVMVSFIKELSMSQNSANGKLLNYGESVVYLHNNKEEFLLTVGKAKKCEFFEKLDTFELGTTSETSRDIIISENSINKTFNLQDFELNCGKYSLIVRPSQQTRFYNLRLSFLLNKNIEEPSLWSWLTNSKSQVICNGDDLLLFGKIIYNKLDPASLLNSTNKYENVANIGFLNPNKSLNILPISVHNCSDKANAKMSSAASLLHFMNREATIRLAYYSIYSLIFFGGLLVLCFNSFNKLTNKITRIKKRSYLICTHCNANPTNTICGNCENFTRYCSGCILEIKQERDHIVDAQHLTCGNPKCRREMTKVYCCE